MLKRCTQAHQYRVIVAGKMNYNLHVVECRKHGSPPIMNSVNLNRINPVFICGFPSGGTDLLKTILNAHPLVHISSEMPFLYHLPKYGYSSVSTFESQAELEKLRNLLLRLDVWKNLENIDGAFELPSNHAATLPELLRFWFNASTKAIWGNKTPQNTEHISDICQLFDRPKFIFITRDVRDVCLSWRKKWARNVFLCSLKWRQRMRSGLDQLKGLSPEDSLIIRYEDLVRDIKGTTQQIARFLDVAHSDEMANFHEHVKVKFDGKINYGEPLKSSNTEKWRSSLSVAEVKRIEEYSYDTMQLLGYQPEYATQQVGLPSIYQLMYNAMDAYSMIFSGNRYAKDNGFFSRLKSIGVAMKSKFN